MNRWEYPDLRQLTADEPLPLVLVDLDILDANIRRLSAVARRAGKRLRVASKSVRVPDLLKHIIKEGGDHFRGLMCFSVPEAHFLSRQGFDDLLVAYPTVQSSDLDLLYEMRADGVDVTVMIDCAEHVHWLQAGWAQRGGSAGPGLPVCVEVDMSYRPLGAKGPHLGVQRSPVRSGGEFRELLRRLKKAPELSLRGVMGYEAQIAGVGEQNPFSRLLNPVKQLLKNRSVPDVARKRSEVARYLEEEGFRVSFFNGGGTGSIHSTTAEPWITEVTAGSGFLQSHLFDYYADNANEPAFCFALQVTRKPEPGMITCQSGGFIASGEIGEDKAPVPFRPEGMQTVKTEGFGEVQTPLRVPPSTPVAIGDPVFFRPAKAGEIAERFSEYLLKRGGKIVGRAKTYRGLGQTFF